MVIADSWDHSQGNSPKQLSRGAEQLRRLPSGLHKLYGILQANPQAKNRASRRDSPSSTEAKDAEMLFGSEEFSHHVT